MTELEVNRASHLIDPHLMIWGWEIPVYLFLGGVTAGIMILAPLLWRRAEGQELSTWARFLPFAPAILLSLGMLALFLDLEYKLHVLRFYAAFRPSSPMSWGSWILIAIYPATLLMGLQGLKDAEFNKLVSLPLLKIIKPILEPIRKFASNHSKGLQTANIVLGIGLGGYTGLLLGTLGARHLWNSAVLGPLFLTSGISTGAALMMLFPLNKDERHFLTKFDIGAILVELGLIAVYLVGLITGGEAARAAASQFLGGAFTAPFFTLVIIAGLLVPFIIEVVETRRHLNPTLVAPALLLIGGLSLRWILVQAGQVGI